MEMLKILAYNFIVIAALLCILGISYVLIAVNADRKAQRNTYKKEVTK